MAGTHLQTHPYQQYATARPLPPTWTVHVRTGSGTGSLDHPRITAPAPAPRAHDALLEKLHNSLDAKNKRPELAVTRPHHRRRIDSAARRSSSGGNELASRPPVSARPPALLSREERRHRPPGDLGIERAVVDCRGINRRLRSTSTRNGGEDRARGGGAGRGGGQQLRRQVLERLPDGGADCRVSYTQDLHVRRADGITALCMADHAAGRRIPFAFLEDIHGRFVKTYGRAALTALAYAMNDEFSRVLSQQMDYCSNDPNADQISRMRGETDQARSVMLDNIDRVLERGDRLELLVDKTASPQGNTMRLKRQARRLRNTMWWRNVKLTAAVIFVLSVIIYIVLAYVCHGFTLPTCVG